jgi:hypothetical protein
MRMSGFCICEWCGKPLQTCTCDFIAGGFVSRRMSNFGQPKKCINSCGQMIYFDANSTIGHPSNDRWVPLDYIDEVRTNQAHQCPKRSNGGSNIARQQQQVQEQTDVILQIKLLTQKVDKVLELLEESNKN